MKATYRVLAYLVAAGVFVQAGAIALGWFTTIHELDDGAVIDSNYEGNIGHSIHGTVGTMVIPLLVIALLIVSFFAKFAGAVRYALIIFGLDPAPDRAGVRGVRRPGGRRPARDQRARAARGEHHGRRRGCRGARRRPTPRPRPPPPPEHMTEREALGRRRRVVAAVVAAVLVVGPLAWFWWTSLVPANASVMDMGYPDTGGGPTTTRGRPRARRRRRADRERRVAHRPVDGRPRRRRDADGRVAAPSRSAAAHRPGLHAQRHVARARPSTPRRRPRAGDAGQPVGRPTARPCTGTASTCPNAEDGVAGVTQDAVPVGGSHVYRFVVEDAGTFWYHSHQVSHAQVRGGLFGVLVVAPGDARRRRRGRSPPCTRTGRRRRSTASPDDLRADAAARRPRPRPRGQHRLRGAARVGARAPTTGCSRSTVATCTSPGRCATGRGPRRGGGRADLEVTVPADGSRRARAARVAVGGRRAVGDAAGRRRPARDASTCSPTARPTDVGFDPRAADRTLHLRDRPAAGLRRRPPGPAVDHQRAHVPRRPDVRRPRGRRRPDDAAQLQRPAAPDAPARPPPARPVPRRGTVDRQPVVDRLAGGDERGDVRGRVRRRQPRHLDGPLPQPPARAGRGSSRTWPTTG